MPRRHVAVIGYGSGGQAAALALARSGHSVEVFERVPHPGPVGAGFLLQPSGLQALWQLGLLDQACMLGVPIGRLHGETAQGRAVMDMRYRDLDARLCGVGMQRGALFAMLHDVIAAHAAVELHPGHAIVELDCEAGRMRDASGRWHGPFDIVVVADGASSGLRAAVTGMRIDAPYPWGALWCLLQEGDWPWPGELRQRYRLARQMAGMLPVGCMPGDPARRLSFFWSVPSRDFGAWRAAGRDAWMRELQALWPEAHARLGVEFDVDCLARATYRDAVPKRWWKGRAVLLGDAAHAMSPQLGQGVNMALADAASLAVHVSEAGSLEACFATHEAERRAHLSAYHRLSRWLTPMFQSDRDLMARCRDAAFLPLGRLPVARGQMLRVLAGTQQGWWGRYRLDQRFPMALQDAILRSGAAAA